MFKLSFDLPKPKKENGKLKNRKERKVQDKVGADDLQAMFRQLGRGSVDDSDPKEISAPLEKNTSSAKSDKRSRQGEQSQQTTLDQSEFQQVKRKKGKQAKIVDDNKRDLEVASQQAQTPKGPTIAPQDSSSEPADGPAGGPANRPANRPVDGPVDGPANQPANQPTDAPTNAPTDKPTKSAKSAKSKAPPAPPAPSKKLTPMQLKMQQKLSGGRFRWINEQLYTVPSDEALKLFKKSPDMFNEYHTGFRHQVESWPENPVDNMIKTFKERLQKPLSAPGGLPADRDGTVVVADMGCGEAELALQVSKLKGTSKSRKVKFRVHSFDLHKANDRITVADIANTPLGDDSAHIVVFCLALMGTNTEDFIREALRIVKPYGEIWIAEIKSRFDIVNNKTDTQRFVDKLKSYGLHHKSTDDTNKMFVAFQFLNVPRRGPRTDRPKFIDEEKKEDTDAPLLKPCIYKKR